MPDMWSKDLPDNPEADRALDELVPGWRDMPLADVKAKLQAERESIESLLIELLGFTGIPTKENDINE